MMREKDIAFERERFESFCKRAFGWDTAELQWQDGVGGYYEELEVDRMWSAWKARAEIEYDMNGEDQ